MRMERPEFFHLVQRVRKVRQKRLVHRSLIQFRGDPRHDVDSPAIQYLRVVQRYRKSLPSVLFASR